MIDLDNFVHEHEKALRNFAVYLTRSEDEAEDLIQDTWMKCITFQQMLESMTSQKQRSWLFTVLKNRWLDILRKRKLEGLAQAEMKAPVTNAVPVYQLEVHLDKLPPLEREIIRLRFWQGYNSRQISEEMGIPEGTVRWRLKLGMDKMKNFIEKSDKEERCQL
jgi:RNA polymerase sigma-70 factor, ECF subfamily